MTLAQILGDTEDATILKSAANESVTKVTSTGGRDTFQSGESRAWTRGGNVD